MTGTDAPTDPSTDIQPEAPAIATREAPPRTPLAYLLHAVCEEITILRTLTTLAIIAGVGALGAAIDGGAQGAVNALQLLAYPAMIVSVWMGASKAATEPAPMQGGNAALRGLVHCLAGVVYPLAVVVIGLVCASLAEDPTNNIERATRTTPADATWMLAAILGAYALRSAHRVRKARAEVGTGSRRSTLAGALILVIGSLGASLAKEESIADLPPLEAIGAMLANWSWWGIAMTPLAWWTLAGAGCVVTFTLSITQSTKGKPAGIEWLATLVWIWIVFAGVSLDNPIGSDVGSAWYAMGTLAVLSLLFAPRPLPDAEPLLATPVGPGGLALILATGAVIMTNPDAKLFPPNLDTVATLAIAGYWLRDMAIYALFARTAPNEPRIGAIWFVWMVTAWGVLTVLANHFQWEHTAIATLTLPMGLLPVTMPETFALEAFEPLLKTAATGAWIAFGVLLVVHAALIAMKRARQDA